MSDGLGLSSRVGVFPCPNCQETINTSMQVCSFCSSPIDPAAAAAAALQFARVNQACSDASYLKIMAGSAFTFYLLRFVPFLNLMAIVALWFLEAAIPLMTIRWWAKFGDLRIDDPGFAPRPAHRVACGSRSRSLPFSYRTRRIQRRNRRISFLVQRRMLEAGGRQAHWSHPNHDSGCPILRALISRDEAASREDAHRRLIAATTYRRESAS